ncbi:ATP-binding protein [Actinoplanes sp. NEAU-A12]|uniref:ATP-binding protein n=1 Tax=Actinoplanes sandaracinus TaxID=3045177 RepID=A0ABT6WW78_9ACTN|nr:ATP-binding protein [Actinoplanes sandaracinus]MDI6103975.1 ATP-binding protein [Actinoplanes sandaracinus]
MDSGPWCACGECGDPATESVDAFADLDTGAVDVAVRGCWGRRLWRQAFQALSRCLAAHPTGLVIDLHHLGDRRAFSAPLWLTARAQGAGMQPPVPVLACLPASAPLAARLDRRETREHVPIFATTCHAHTALTGRREPADRLRLSLPPRCEVAAAAARQAVADVCRSWHLPRLAHLARLVVSELVANAVEHADPPIEVCLSRLGAASHSYGMHLAVYDANPRIPARPRPDRTPPPSWDQRGMGLRVVDAAAFSWGALPTRTGKMVWATLHDRPNQMFSAGRA